MNRRDCFLLLVIFLVPTRLVHAGEAEAKEREARMACLSGDYIKGVTILSELFVDTKSAAFIYNQGRCFEQNRRYEDAIARFQEYLRVSKKASKGERAEAQKHINDCKALLADQPSQPPAVSPTPAPAASPTPTSALAEMPKSSPSPAVVTTSPTMIQQTSAVAPSDKGSSLRTWGIVTASVGGAALIGGVFLNLKVNSMASDLEKTDGYSDGKESDRKSYQTLGWFSYSVGAACVATGAVLYILGLRSDGTSPASLSLVPALAPGQAGAFLKGAF
jgi:hypothetical protein